MYAYSKIAGGGKASAFYGGLMSCKDPRMGDMFGHAAKVFLCFYKLYFISRSRSTFGVLK